MIARPHDIGGLPGASVAPRHWTVADLLTWTEGHFAGLGVATPRLDAELLLAHALGSTRLELYTGYHMAVEAEERGRFRALVERRSRREPVAYILGTREFYSLPLEVTPAVLIPRPETEHLVDRVIRELHGAAAPWVLDLGTGSGNIAIALLVNLPGSSAVGVDVSAEALEVARRNAGRHGVDGRLELVEGDLFEPLSAAGRALVPFDAVVSNPPYVSLSEHPKLMPDVRDFEPATALLDRKAGSGLGFYAEIARGAAERLVAGGLVALEVGAAQASRVEGLLREAGWERIHTVSDYAGIPRVVTARRPDA